jgi:hypothetical protein
MPREPKKLSLGLASALATVAMVAAVVPPSALAVYQKNYCGILTQPYSDCSNNSGQQFTSSTVANEAYYNGNGYISVCQKIISSTFGQISRTCNPASCDCNFTNSGDKSDPFDYVTGYVGDNWAYAHTINRRHRPRGIGREGYGQNYRHTKDSQDRRHDRDVRRRCVRQRRHRPRFEPRQRVLS